ncbi:hypothetical protein JHK87_000912 [Glycine soja]|nr:hypothetical protein JHK87_000912 [Glycine soja]
MCCSNRASETLLLYTKPGLANDELGPLSEDEDKDDEEEVELKSRNLPIGALVKSTYLRCNALFNKRGRKTATMLASGHVYKQVLNKAIEDAQRKANTHAVLEFDQLDTIFGPGNNKPVKGSTHWRFHD